MIEASMPAREPCRASRAASIPCVFVVDDDNSVRDSLQLLLESAGWQARAFACTTDFLAHPRRSGPSCVVVDVGLLDMDGFDLQNQFAADRVATPIVFISGNADIAMSVRAMKGGAVEFLTKPLREDALLAAVGIALDISKAGLLREVEMTTLRNRYASLTFRESQVLALAVSGRLNKQIAAELGISEITVKAHRGSMTRKMMARSIPELVKMAASLGIGT